MPQPRSTSSMHPRTTGRPGWSAALRALREAAGVTQDGWAARLGVSRATVQRWEAGEAVPNVEAEAAIAAACGEKGLFRAFAHGSLAGLTVTPDLLRDLLAEGRLGAPPAGAAPRRAVPGAAAAPAAPRPPAPTDVPAAPPHAAPPTNLPEPATSFIGREQELEELLALAPAARLLTLTGAGGIGKSRLAIEVARRLRHRYPGGAWLVELAALPAERVLRDRRPAEAPASLDTGDGAMRVVQAVAAVLDVREEPGRPLLASLVERLREMVTLIVLDNGEHVALACAGLAATLRRECPHVALLTTSRAPLGIAGETAWRVPPLAVEGAGRDADAVRLFVERARAARHGFALTDEDAAAAVEVCRRLDGIPLAIELAAARVNVLAVAQIAARLDDRFRLLTRGSRDAPSRQHTLRATLDWSHDLLTEEEQTVLRRLAVFAGGTGVEAAEAVCAGDVIEPALVLDLLAQLIERSLLAVDVRGGEARYRLLETVRQYAAEKLEAAGEAAAVRRRHLEWCRAYAVAGEAALRGAGQARQMEALEREHDNVRTALDWGLSSPPDAATALHLAAAMRMFWVMRGHVSEGRRWLEAALAVAVDAPPALRAQAMDGAAALAHSQGDVAGARLLLERSLALWRTLDNAQGMAIALNMLGIIRKSEGDLERAAAALDESLALWRQIDNAWGAATVLNNLSALAVDRGDYARALVYSEESLALKRELGDRAGIAGSLHNMGEAARYLRDYPRAAALLGESLALSREMNNVQRIPQTLHSLALVALQDGHIARAAALLAEAAELFRLRDDRIGLTVCLEAWAEAAMLTRDHARAARLLGAAEALREALGSPLPPADRAARERTVATLCTELGEDAFAAARAAGRALPLQDALAHARAADKIGPPRHRAHKGRA